MDSLVDEAERRYAEAIRERVIRRLVEALDREHRDTPRVESEQAAIALIRGMAQELSQAAQNLYQAAEAVKQRGGFGKLASDLHRAAQRADRAAQDLVRG